MYKLFGDRLGMKFDKILHLLTILLMRKQSITEV